MFTVKWALSNVADPVRYKYDLHVEEAYYRLRDAYRRESPEGFPLSRTTRRLPPGIGTPFTLNYQPLYTFQPQGSDYPLAQLGSGVFTANQDGGAYEFEAFVAFVADSISKLADAYGEDRARPRPIAFDFLLTNEIALADFDAFTGVDVRTKASTFVKERFGMQLSSPLDAFGAEMTLYRQETSQRYRIHETGDIFSLSVEDASEAEDRQFVAFDLRVSTPTEVEGLDLSEAVTWLRSAHSRTHDVFMKLREDRELNLYFRTPPKPTV